MQHCTRNKKEWILCPICGSKIRNKVTKDTILINYPLYCPKCRQETLIEAKNLQVIVIKEPDKLDAEPRKK
jgi:Zn-finger nucleic acid-binding protein